ncbi:hypothetical protein [Sandarakinorhabdus sp. DWP1-3-1]|uniref:hypothetical protein n=1 Tax=Sandarakinorhabdus sp. DWP1-3-1 TaxID=2804627 RepID=UPI003CECF86C
MFLMFKIAVTAFLATALWIVPSVGTRGQGTLGDRFVHADRGIVEDTLAGHRLLDRADAINAVAVARL